MLKALKNRIFNVSVSNVFLVSKSDIVHVCQCFSILSNQLRNQVLIICETILGFIVAR